MEEGERPEEGSGTKPEKGVKKEAATEGGQERGDGKGRWGGWNGVCDGKGGHDGERRQDEREEHERRGRNREMGG